jgi:hypothetical protein
LQQQKVLDPAASQQTPVEQVGHEQGDAGVDGVQDEMRCGVAVLEVDDVGQRQRGERCRESNRQPRQLLDGEESLDYVG